MITYVIVAIFIIIALCSVFALKPREKFIKYSSNEKRQRLLTLNTDHYDVSDIKIINNQAILKYMKKHSHTFLHYDALDNQKRPTGVLLSWHHSDTNDWFDMKRRYKHRRHSRPGLISDPVGWNQRFVTLSAPYQIVSYQQNDPLQTHVLERTHLIPFWITQNQSNQRNLVPMPQYTNKGFEGSDISKFGFASINMESMLAIETEIKAFLIENHELKYTDILQVYVQPFYDGTNYVPKQVRYLIGLRNDQNALPFQFMGYDIPTNHLLEITLPVQMKDGTKVSILEKEPIEKHRK